MGIFFNLSVLALRQLSEGATQVIGLKAAGDSVDAVVGFLGDRFSDHSQRLSIALHHANERAWKALEIALAGDSLWSWLERGEDKAFRQQVRDFLAATPLAGLPSHGQEFRQQCLRELRAARKAGLLTGGSLAPKELARQAGQFARFAEPQRLLDAEWQAIDQLAGELRLAHYGNLAHLMTLRPAEGPPLLAVAVRYFFRRAVEKDAELHRGLSWATWDNLAEEQRQGFSELAEALAGHGQNLEEMLGALGAVCEVVLDLRSEIQGQREQIQHLAHEVLQVLGQHQLERRELRPGDSLSIRTEEERHLVKELVARYRALPAEQRRLPALLNALGKLEVVAGEFDAAQRDFQEVAALATDPRAQAEAHYNLYQAALERRQWTKALAALRQAATLDPERFLPFPLTKYEPQRILGAGGFGVAFLCRDCHSGSQVVVKSLQVDGLERPVEQVFREARVLEELDHPAIIRLRYCDYADAGHTRPYLVMDYFEGPTLAEFVDRHGPLSADELVTLAGPVAEALLAAHGKGILHRDVKPANLLVRREGTSWRVKLIDFGLALKQSVIYATVSSPAVRAQTSVGYSVAGSLDYAAPEQMGRLLDVPVGPYSDVYGFGKTCCYALFRTTQPLPRHWRGVPESLADLLENCLAEKPADRPATCAAVLERLRKPTTEKTPATRIPKPLPPASPLSPSEKKGREGPSWFQSMGTRYLPPPSSFWVLGRGVRLLLTIATALHRGITWMIERFIGQGIRTILRGVVGTLLGGMVGLAAGLTAAESTHAGDKGLLISLLVPFSAAAGGIGLAMGGRRAGLAEGMDPKPAKPLGCLAVPARLLIGAIAAGGTAGLAVGLGMFWIAGPTAMISCLVVLGGVLGALWGWGRRSSGVGALLGILVLGTVAAGAALLDHADSGAVFGDVIGLLMGAFTWFSIRVRPEASTPARRAFARALAASLVVGVGALLFLGLNLGWLKGGPPEVRRFDGHWRVTNLAFAPDGERVLSGEQSGTVRLWDLRNGRELDRFHKSTSDIGYVGFTSDSRPVCITANQQNYYDAEVQYWDVGVGQAARSTTLPYVNSKNLVFSADGHRALNHSDDYYDHSMKLFDLDNGKPLMTFTGHAMRVTSKAISPDGQLILSGSDDQTVRLWDAKTGKEKHNSKKHATTVKRVAFSPNGQYAISVGEKSTVSGLSDWTRSVWVWKVDSWSDFHSLQGHTGLVTSVAFSPDNSRVLTGSEDGTVRLWDVETGEELLCFKRHRSWFLGHSGGITAVAFSPDGSQALSCGGDGTVRLWQVP